MERNNLKKKRLPISIDRKLIFREFRTKALSKKEEKMVIKYGRQNYVEQNYVEQNYVEQNYVEQNYGRKKLWSNKIMSKKIMVEQNIRKMTN